MIRPNEPELVLGGFPPQIIAHQRGRATVDVDQF